MKRIQKSFFRLLVGCLLMMKNQMMTTKVTSIKAALLGFDVGMHAADDEMQDV